MPKQKKERTPEAIERFGAALNRIKDISGCRTQVLMAEFLDVRQSSISDAKRRCSIPAEWLLKIWRKTGYSPDYVMDGDKCGHRFATASTEQGEAVNACVLREEIERDVKHQMDNLHLEDLIERIQEINPNIQIHIPARTG
jgi:hypothetical protein